MAHTLGGWSITKLNVILGTAALTGLLVALPASADTIVVSLSPVSQTVGVGELFDVDIVASIPASDAVIGWGLDFIFPSPQIGQVGYSINTMLWDAAPDTPDGDGLAAIVSAPPGIAIWGSEVLLATIQLQALQAWPTPVPLTLSDDSPDDLTEGFVRDPGEGGGFATVDYVGGEVFIPEPVTSVLLIVGGVIALARRKRA